MVRGISEKWASIIEPTRFKLVKVAVMHENED
jgi:hypothetical protein